MRGLCNINVWRRKSGNSMEDSMSQSVMYVANIPAGMQLWQQEIKNPCIQAPDFPPPVSRGPGKWERILQIRKKLHNQSKARIPSLAA